MENAALLERTIGSLDVFNPLVPLKAEWVPDRPQVSPKMQRRGIYETGEYDKDSESMSSEDSSSGEDLADSLFTKAVKSAFDRKQFWPCGSLDGVITPQTVHGKLKSSKGGREDLDSLVDFIIRRGKKVFAISLCIGLEGNNVRQAITQFQRNGIDDMSLPLTEESFSDSQGRRWKGPWNNLRVNAFCTNQWEFLALIFDNHPRELSLASEVIFPFIQTNQRGLGAFGEVHEVTIHPAHQPMAVYNSSVAVKRLHRAYTENQAMMEELQQQWEREVDAHRKIATCNHANIIKFMAAITRDYERYLMFEWADGGNLRQFWQSHEPHLASTLVEDVISQLHGLASALSKIHSRKYRHGDLKPENILRFKTPGNHSSKIDLGTLKICDMGLTKYHHLATQYRQNATDTRFTTWRYEPPEATGNENAWPRRYDTWSLGCIMLEFIVWLVRGVKNLEEFNRNIVNEFNNPIHYFEPVKTNGGNGFKVHKAVSAEMEGLAKYAECKAGRTALGDVLEIVRTKLLVVELDAPPTGTAIVHQNGTNPQTQSRAHSSDLKKDLAKIIDRGKKNPSYWLKGENSDDLPHINMPQAVQSEQKPPYSLTVNRKRSSGGARDLPTTDSSYLLFPRLTGGVGVQLHDIWKFQVDNNFATKIVDKKILAAADGLQTTRSKDRCTQCQELKFYSPRFSIVDSWKELEARLYNCDFCRMRWDTCSHLDRREFPVLAFHRDQSMLMLSGSDLPVLAIRRGPGKSHGFEIVVCTYTETRPTENLKGRARTIQIGHPQLPDSASQAHFHFLRQCLTDCNSEHPECRPPKPRPLPTRLIYLGTEGHRAIHLCDTEPLNDLQYVALSHPWGKEPHFCTTSANIAAHRKRIDFTALPAMFQDAVITTRELGLRYLWIDSICIVQGEGGDFDEEAKRMEDVFSSAFCVIAASSAEGQNDSFLNRQTQQGDCLTFEHEGLPPLYVSRFMDDFNRDVLEAPLSKRGWVLQERALARRTIYFTDNQTYWECGKGVRCETLTKMDNKLVSFLGDPNFPSKLSNDATTRGEKIQLYEELYRQYTRLEFTHISDRPIAIAGLERRLVRDLKAQGGFGVFDDGRSLFQRSLLWMRAREAAPMTKIRTAPSLPVPSWSWMGYDGAIDYLGIPFRDVKWLKNAIRSPWAFGGADTWHTGDGKEVVELKAWAWHFKPGDVRLAPQKEMELFCDTRDVVDWEVEDLMCVVAGIEDNSSAIEERKHFVLFIKVSTESLGPKEGHTPVYERFGVGHMKGKYIGQSSSRKAVVIR